MESAFKNKTMEPYLCSYDSIITEVSKEFIEFTGFATDELLGKSLIEIGAAIRINSQVLLDNITVKYSGYIYTKSLSAREVDISLFHSKGTNEKKYTFIEKPNSRLDDKLIFEKQTLSDNIVGVAIYSVPDLIMLKVNQKYLDFHDSPYNEEKISIGLTIREIITGYAGSQSEVITNTVIETKQSSYLKEIKFNTFARGITYWDSTRTPIFDNGKMKYMMLTTSEATERVLKNQSIERQNKIIAQQKEQLESQKKQLEVRNTQLIAINSETIEQSRKVVQQKEAIRSRYELISRIIDTFGLPVVRLSCADLQIVGINKRAFSIIKLLNPNIKSINQLKRNNIEEFVTTFKALDTIKWRQYINEVIGEKKTKYLNNQEFFVDGEQVHWNIIFEPVLYVNGEIQEILIVVIDVTAEINSNIVMEKTLKLQGEFLANISHELKTPLNVIFAAVQLFSMYCSNGSLDGRKDSIVKYIQSIKQNSYRLSKLINNIVDSSKIEAGFFQLNISNNNIVEVVEEIVMSVTDFTDSKGINIIFDTDIEEKIIACDPEKIERIVLNLISNAIKFSEEGGEIFVDIKCKNDFVEISVKDNGIGIEKQYLKMIFDRFKQVDKSLSRNSEGTGIGLSLVKSIVELHGGSIHVESECGRGSKFTVMLPSINVFNENNLYDREVGNKKQCIQVELSDVSL
jgi:signal transduction histidine kinase